MNLDINNLILQNEKTYFKIILVFSIIIWIVVAITVVGLLYALFLVLFLWITNGLFVARIKSESVAVNEHQLPELYKNYLDVCHKLELIEIPALFVIQSGGVLNAFATRHSQRNFIVVYSDALEGLGADTDAMRFLLGHEIGHVKRKHIIKQLFIFPGLILPLLGSAYHRACEATCDRFGAFATNNVEGAITAIMVISGGKESGKTMSSQAFAEQAKNYRGFFVSWHELTSGYPTLARRVAYLEAIKNGESQPHYHRNPLAYFFAFFTFGSTSSGGNFIITIAIIALLAAIAIPNLLRAKIGANDVLAQSTLQSLSSAAESYAKFHKVYPSSINILLEAEPAYLTMNYCEQIQSGFTYKCEMSEQGYKFTAIPVEKGTTGTDIYSVSNEENLLSIDEDLAEESQGINEENKYKSLKSL